MALFRAVAFFLSGGDSEALCSAITSKSTKQQPKQLTSDSFQLLINNIKKMHEKEKNECQKQKLLGLVSSLITRPKLAKMGWEVGKTAWTSSRKRATKSKPPPNCKPLSSESLEKVTETYLQYVVPMGNRMLKDRKTNLYEPVLGRIQTKKFIHRNFLATVPKQLHVAYSTFCKLQPWNVRLSTRKLDVCAVCESGKHMTKIYSRMKNQSTSTPEEISRVEENLRLLEAHQRICGVQRDTFNQQRKDVKRG
jgi:hypothetical protein